MILEQLENIIEEVHEMQEADNPWISSKFYKMDKLKLDYSGKVGERFIERVCRLANVECVYEEDKIDSEGHYDLLIVNKRVEIKTARRSKCGSWQHEGLKQKGCDFYMLIDVEPREDVVYLTLLKSAETDLTRKHPILGRTPHLRDQTTGVYKFDFGQRTIEKGLKHGLTMKVCKQTDLQQVADFITNKVLG